MGAVFDISTDDLIVFHRGILQTRVDVLHWVSLMMARLDWHSAITGQVLAPVTPVPITAAKLQLLHTHGLRLASRLQQLADAIASAAELYGSGESVAVQELQREAARLWRDALGRLSMMTTSLGFGESAGVGFGDSDVGVRATAHGECAPLRGYADLLQRVPAATEDAPQVRIEQRGSEAIVYIGGTVDFGLTPGAEPWDMTSNIAALGVGSAASVQATEMAMRDAGISSTERVVLVGHSQGGLVAARIAQSPQWRVTDVVTAGAPIRQIDLPPGIRVLALEHEGDPIPALSGAPSAGLRVLILRRDAGPALPTAEDSLPAHNLARYRESAALADASANPMVQQERANLVTPSSAAAEQCRETTWRAERRD